MRIRIPLLFFIFILFESNGYAQSIKFAKSISGNSQEIAKSSTVDNLGNIYVVGSFEGTNIDFDPSTSAYLMSSNGLKDIFVSKFDKDGLFVWAFKIGGSNHDEANDIEIDHSGNLVITGFFRGLNVDFDPSATESVLNSNGESGGDPGYGGDVFVAKYDMAGKHKWSFNIGGTAIGENGIGIGVDNNDNVLVTGYFNSDADFDPSSGNKVIDGSTSSIFIAKYSATGNYQWVITTGQPYSDNSGFDITSDKLNNVIVTGYFQGSNIDFDPSAATNTLSSVGGFEYFVAKYTSNGSYVWAKSAGGEGADVGRSLITDLNNNIYVTGDYNSAAINFNSGNANNIINNKGANDFFVVKYASQGTHQWSFGAGGNSVELGWSITEDDLHNIIIGGAVASINADFDPSITTANISSAGGYDAFAAKYSLNGDFICGFNIGGSNDDLAYSISSLGNDVFIAGQFNGNNIDFDPGSSISLLSSIENDAFFGKYEWSPPVAPSGIISGSIICPGSTGKMTFTSITGIAPFTLTITDGINTFEQSGVLSGIPFSLNSSPSTTTLYYIKKIKDAAFCSSETNVNMAVEIIVSCGIEICDNGIDDDGDGLTDCADSECSIEKVIPSGNITMCYGDTTQLNATGGTKYQWFPSNGLNNSNIQNPKASPQVTTIYKVISTGPYGCKDSANVTVTIHPKLNIEITPNSNVCLGDSIQLNATGGTNYKWKPTITLNNSLIANPKASPFESTVYSVMVTDDRGCSDSAKTTISVKSKPIVTLTPSTTICSNDSIILNASGGINYSWFPTTSLNNPNSPNPIAAPLISTTYIVNVKNADGCTASGQTTISIRNIPLFNLGNDTSICEAGSIEFDASLTDAESYLWNTGSINPKLNVTKPGPYFVAVTLKGCTNSVKDTVLLSILKPPKIELGKDTTICNFNSFQIKGQATDIKDYLWSTGSTDSSINISNEGLYSLIVKNECGTNQDDIYVKFEQCSNELFFPTAFTPNGDGKNDFFKAAYFNGQSFYNYELKIFNRWGELVFSTKELDKGWNGIFKGKLQSTNTFVWYVTFRKNTNEPIILKKGTVNLIR